MSIKSHRKPIQAKSSTAPIILVVEDDEDNLLYISHALVFLQYSFITASQGKVALDLAIKYKIDLALVDLILPDISGFELASLLRQNECTKNMPIIATSALIRKQEQEKAIKAGCNDYLSKPYLIEELDCKIRQYLPHTFFKHKPDKAINQLALIN